MSHIHIPDGILPPWMLIIAYLIVILYLFGLGIYIKKFNCYKKMALVGIFSALMLLTMSIEILPISYHLNLAVLTGIIIGPILSTLVIFIVNIISALIGHGGITVIGLNTLVISLEAIIGYYLFKLIKRNLKNIFATTFITTIIALFISTWSCIGIVYISTNNIEGLFEHNHEHHADAIKHSNTHISVNSLTDNKMDFDITKFIYLVISLGSIGWTIEGIINAFVISYIHKIKPELLE